MSEIFEGVISTMPLTAATSFTDALSKSLLLGTTELAGGLTVVYRTDPREASQFTDEIDQLAREISAGHSRALVVRYDSRIGHRSSHLYVEGVLSKGFDEQDELFVALDEEGNPMTHGPRTRFLDLSPENEYETIQNAIELGLAELGGGSWHDLKQLIGSV